MRTSTLPRTIVEELQRRRAALSALDKEASGPVGKHRRLELRTTKARLLEEIEALEVALRLSHAPSSIKSFRSLTASAVQDEPAASHA